MALASHDFGHIVESRPLGVVRPRSGGAVQETVSFAGARGLPVAARGSGHAPYGQGQAHGGYVVDRGGLDEVQYDPRHILTRRYGLWA
ncbi:FAD-binding protein [Streptomyces sp. NPDC001652]|uniref:FAD-binding protein n=1 Tax=Streptomyces sp. NPDC001652 TaxID=3154393 RepID=UPI00331AABE2